MITITYHLNIDEMDLDDLPPGGIGLLEKRVNAEIAAVMKPIKQGIIDRSIFNKTGIRSTGKLRNKCVTAGRS